MLRILCVLVAILVFGCSPLNGKEPPPIPSAFPYQCNGPFKDKIPSDEVVLKVRIAHEKWLKDPKDPDGQKANFCGAKLSSGKFQKAHLQVRRLSNGDVRRRELFGSPTQRRPITGRQSFRGQLCPCSSDRNCVG